MTVGTARTTSPPRLRLQGISGPTGAKIRCAAAQFLAKDVAKDLTTELARRRDFLVVARPTSVRFASGGALARDPGVRDTMTGDLRHADDRISLLARLVDEDTGRSLWVVRRHQGSDFFALCNRLIEDLSGQIDAEIRHTERERTLASAPAHLGARGMFHRGMWHGFHFSPTEMDRAEDCFGRVLALAPKFGLGHAGLGHAAIVRAVMPWDRDPTARMAAGLKHARAGFECDPVSPFVCMVYGRLLLKHGEGRQAFKLLTMARDRHPSCAHLHYCLALSNHGEGKPDLALAAIDRAIQLSPRDPLTSMFMTMRAGSYYFTNRPAEAEAAARGALTVSRNALQAATVLALIHAEKGEAAQARALLTGPDGALPSQSGTTT